MIIIIILAIYLFVKITKVIINISFDNTNYNYKPENDKIEPYVQSTKHDTEKFARECNRLLELEDIREREKYLKYTSTVYTSDSSNVHGKEARVTLVNDSVSTTEAENNESDKSD